MNNVIEGRFGKKKAPAVQPGQDWEVNVHLRYLHEVMLSAIWYAMEGDIELTERLLQVVRESNYSEDIELYDDLVGAVDSANHTAAFLGGESNGN